MKFLLHISASPSSPFASAAYEYAAALHTGGHQIIGLFFSGDGAETFHPQKNTELQTRWKTLTEELKLNALCCSAALTLKPEIQNPLLPRVEIAGLGQLIDLSTQADRTVSFGSRELP